MNSSHGVDLATEGWRDLEAEEAIERLKGGETEVLLTPAVPSK